jgi:tetratricopeptide (TPR) repeat protein
LRDRLSSIRALSDAGKLDSARALYTAAMDYARRQTFDSDWLAHLGALAEPLGDRRAAVELRDRVAKIVKPDDRNDAESINLLQAEVALIEGRAGAARESFNRANAASASSDALAGAGRAARAERRYAEADSLYAAVIARGPWLTEELPSFFEAHLARGELAAERGDTASARQHFQWILTQWAGGDTDLVVRQAAQKGLAALSRSK